MRRNEALFATPPAGQTAKHLAGLVHTARLARGWTLPTLAERARVSMATLRRIESGSVSASLGAWLSVLEPLGLLPRLAQLSDPASQALLDETRAKRGRKSMPARDLDF